MAKLRGVDIYIEVNTGTHTEPVWTKVGGQKGGTLTMSLTDFDVTDKDSAGFEENMAGIRSVEIEFDAFLIEDNVGYVEMQKGFWERKDLELQVITPTMTYSGYFRLTEMPIEGPSDDAATVSFSLKSTGVVSRATGGEPPAPPPDVIWAASPELADVQAAIAGAEVGDTVMVPDGEATWSEALTITKGITLKAETVGGVTIISGAAAGGDYFDPANFLIAYAPAADQVDKPFRLSGFVLDGNSNRFPFFANNAYLTPVTQFRLDHCEIKNSKGSLMHVFGEIYGVVDNNVLRVTSGFAIRDFGLNATSWENFTFDYATANNLYYEDNTFYLPGDTSGNEGGMGGRYCVRHNTFHVTGTPGINPWFDMHGNMGEGGNWATMGAEIYENVIDANGVSLTLFDHRGGKLIAFNNTASNVNGVNGAQTREEYLDSLNPPATGPTGQPQYVSDSYYWNLVANAEVRYNYNISQTLDYGGIIGVVPRWDVHCFKHVATFDGSSGVGVGLLSERPASCTTEGVAWWATDENKLYRWHNGAWELYYTPYTYPHPLRTTLND